MSKVFDRTARWEMAKIWNRGIQLCREHAEEDGGDRKEQVFDHFRTQLRLGLWLRLMDFGFSPDEAEATLVSVIELAESGSSGSDGRA